MFEQLLKAARDLDDTSSPPDVPELLLRGDWERNPYVAKSTHANENTAAVPDQLSLDHVRSLTIEPQDGSVSSIMDLCSSGFSV